MSDSVRPYGLQHARLLCLWDSPGKKRILEWVAMPPTGNLPDPGIEPTSLASYLLHQQAGSLPLAPPGKPGVRHNGFKFQLCP